MILNILIKINEIRKNIISYLLYYTGLLSLYGSFKLKEKAVVLMYHRVLPADLIKKSNSNKGIIVKQNIFEKQIKFLKKKFQIIDLENFELFLNVEQKYSKPVCLLTFDDGWGDNYTYAFPILQKYKVPAVIFLSYNFIEGEEPFWQEKINRYLKQKAKGLTREEKKIFHLKFMSNCKLDKSKFLNFVNTDLFEHELFKQLKLLNYNQLQNILEYCKIEDVDYFPDVFLNWDQISEMNKNQISFASHGLDHKILTNIPNDDKEIEISKSKKKIENKIKNKVSSFSFPNGNYDNSCIEFLKKHKYQFAFTINDGHVTKNDNKFLLNRINIYSEKDKNIPRFFSSILKIF